jgi:DNA-binding GntR family transcriptional regulator
VAEPGFDLRVTQDKSVRGKVTDVLRQAILAGALTPGRRLTERELTELTGVSRTSVREALRQLEAERLVEASPSRGLRVAIPTAADVEHIYELRMVLEPLAVKLFVERATQEEVDALVAVSEELIPAAANSRDVLEELNQVLLAGCRNPVMEEVLGGLYIRIHALRRISAATPGRVAAVKREYSELVEAIRSRLPEEAAAAALRHVTNARASALVAIGLLEKDVKGDDHEPGR